MDLSRLGFPCPSPTCPHAGECFEATRRRAEGGHACAIVASPKMDTPDLVAASCSCGRYRSAPTVEREARKAWRAHADAKMGWVAPKARTLRDRPGGENSGPPMFGPPEGPVMTQNGWGPVDCALGWVGMAGSRDRHR